MRLELECQLVTNGLYLGDLSGYKDPRRKELEPGADDWTLLIQIDSDDKAKMMWGDGGHALCLDSPSGPRGPEVRKSLDHPAVFSGPRIGSGCSAVQLDFN